MPVYREKVLTLCQWGLTRSVAIRHILILELGVDSIAAGIEKNSRETLRMLGEWADVVIVAAEDLIDHEKMEEIPPGKIIPLNLGNDIWQNPRHDDLWRKAKGQLGPLMARMRHTRALAKPRSSRLDE